MKILGDPHLGRRFLNSVPLHRRGEREQMVRDQFIRELDPQGSILHVCMGDLFDTPDADLDTIWFAANAYIEAAWAHPTTDFVVLQGNHDAHRDLTKVSAFQIFGGLVAGCSNIYPVSHAALWLARHRENVFFPWLPDETAGEIVGNNDDRFWGEATTAWGHWDVDLRSPPHNLIPTQRLAACGFKKAYTGHIHLPGQFTRDGVDVTVTGSMQPYAHGEDATGDWYVSLTKKQIADLDPTTLKNKCVRVWLKPDEATDVELDCLQLKYERVEAMEDGIPIEVTMDGFDLGKTYDEVMSRYDIMEPVKGAIDSRWQATFMRQG